MNAPAIRVARTQSGGVSGVEELQVGGFCDRHQRVRVLLHSVNPVGAACATSDTFRALEQNEVADSSGLKRIRSGHTGNSAAQNQHSRTLCRVWNNFSAD